MIEPKLNTDTVILEEIKMVYTLYIASCYLLIFIANLLDSKFAIMLGYFILCIIYFNMSVGVL